MQQSTKPDRLQPPCGGITPPAGRSPVTIPDINTRFALPIVCPKTGERVSAETLYNRCCADLGYVVRDHVGDLIFDNLDYAADETVCATDASNAALHDAIYAWADSVHAQIGRGQITSMQAASGRHLAPADKAYPYRVMVWEARGDDWRLAEVFEWSTLAGAEHVALETCTEPYPDGVTAMHYVIGEVAL